MQIKKNLQIKKRLFYQNRQIIRQIREKLIPSPPFIGII